METFDLRHVTFSYPGRPRPALEDVSLAVRPGDFLVLCGPSGCGKSTLLRQLKPALTPHGDRSGEIWFQGNRLEELDPRRQAQEIGFVLQSPENQLVTDKVWHELAFGLESLGYDTPTIRRRVAEMAAFFGVQGWFYRNVTDLSGGQKQLLNLASVMAMQPSVLILDEPTSQLDPITAADFLATVAKINRELGTTVILTEHRLEEALPLANRVAVMDGGRILTQSTPQEVGLALREMDHTMFLAMPTPMRVWAAVEEGDTTCPITVREGRDWLEDFADRHTLGAVPPEPVHTYPPQPVLEAEELWFKYEENGVPVVKDMSLLLQKGEFMALLGGNGTGKTTVLKLLAGLIQPYRGEVRLTGTVGLLPQDPQTLFVKKTVGEDLREVLEGRGLSFGEREERIARIVRLCRLEALLDRHPYDLSGGEQQRAALAKVLLLEPQILLLDEPTKGLDAGFKVVLAQILGALLDRGVTILMVSHDVEFCARYAHQCVLFFDGSIVNAATSRAFFSGNSFYTTAANRMARERLSQAVTAGDVVVACGGGIQPEPSPLPAKEPQAVSDPQPVELQRPQPLPRWRKLLAGVLAGGGLVLLAHFMGLLDLSGLLAWAGVTNAARQQLWLYGLFAGALVGLGFLLARGRPEREEGHSPVKGKRPSRRSILAAALVLTLIPLTLLWGEFYLDSRKYYFISLLILLECMAPFFLVFEGRKPQARELVTIATLCAIGVAGRMVFFMLPEFKPVIALVVVAGAALGGETGFLVGSLTMLVSNMLFSQGPWTPWQMFAMGIIGFLAGGLFRKGPLCQRRGSLCVFGALASILVYGSLMNLQSALTWSHELNWGIYLSYCATGFPMDCIHAAATWVFLWFGAQPMLEKLERVRTKYGLGQ